MSDLGGEYGEFSSGESNEEACGEKDITAAGSDNDGGDWQIGNAQAAEKRAFEVEKSFYDGSDICISKFDVLESFYSSSKKSYADKYSYEESDSLNHIDAFSDSDNSEQQENTEDKHEEKLSEQDERSALESFSNEKGDNGMSNNSVQPLSETLEISENQLLKKEEITNKTDKFTSEQIESAKYEKDKKTVEKILESNPNIRELDEIQRQAVLNVAVHMAAERHAPEITAEQFEDIRQKIRFVDNDETAAENNISSHKAKYIQGYYSADGGLRINSEAIGSDAGEILVTIDHETLHMFAQRFDRSGKPVSGITGLKREDLLNSFSNVGMNEGVTEMLASRDMAELLPNREEGSYVREVELMQKYENIVGSEILHNAYMKAGTDCLKKDFDSVMGNGKFDEFCQYTDKMWYYETNGDYSVADAYKRELENILMDYEAKKGEAVDDNN